jgi:hypothetical protein
MNSAYLRALAARCRKSGRHCGDLFAKEEFYRLANEFALKAAELDRPFKGGGQVSRPWIDNPSPFAIDH